MHGLVGLETIHLHQQLVEGLFALVIAAAQAGAAMAPDDRVDFIDEDDAGRILLGLLEHITHTACADADEHLDKIRTGDGEEGHIGLARDGARQQGLAGARRADQQHALGNASAQALEFLRIAQEVHDLLQIILGFIDARHILEGDAALALGQHLGAALAEAHRLAAARLHLAEKENINADQQQHRQRIDQQPKPGRAVIGRRHGDVHMMRGHQVGDAVRATAWNHGGESLAVLESALEIVALHGDVLDVVMQHRHAEIGVVLGGRRGMGAGRVLQHVEQEDQKDRDGDPKGEVSDVEKQRAVLSIAAWAAGP